MMINHAAHGLTPRQAAVALHNLTQSGDLAIYGPAPIEDQPQIPVQPTVNQIEDAIYRNHHPTYQLTPQGGARWESVARPMWDRFVSEGYMDEQSLGEGRTVASINRGLIKHYLENYTYLRAEEDIVLGSVKWSTMKPWQALYWKILPSAVRATFTVTYREMEQDPVWHEQSWLIQQKWIADTTWYSSYDELTGKR